MSSSTTTTVERAELLEDLERDPDEVFQKYEGRLRELADEESNSKIQTLIESVLADQEESS